MAWRYYILRLRPERTFGIASPRTAEDSLAWLKVLIENRRAIVRVVMEAIAKWRVSVEPEVLLNVEGWRQRVTSRCRNAKWNR